MFQAYNNSNHKPVAMQIFQSENNMKPTNKLTRPRIKTSPKDHLDSVLDENLDSLLIKKQEPRYKEDATINFGLLINKSG